MDHISGRSQVYLSERGSDELFEGLKALIHQKKCNLISNFAFKNWPVFPVFFSWLCIWPDVRGCWRH